MNQRLAIVTGDDPAPGMNAALRSVTRRALELGWQVIGICDTDGDLLPEDCIPLTARTVDGISPRGGSLLGCMDTRPMLTETGMNIARHCLTETRVDALIFIGGRETQAAAQAFAQSGLPVNGIAASVENDVAGLEMIIGTDSALNIALDKIDYLRASTPTGHLLHLIEVAGRSSGYLALMSAVVGGAAAVILPETDGELVRNVANVAALTESGDPIIVAAEATYDAVRVRASSLAQERKLQGHQIAHAQRHAAPSAYDRLLATRLGAQAVDALVRGESGVVFGFTHGAIHAVPFAEVVGQAKPLDDDLLHLAALHTVSAALHEH